MEYLSSSISGKSSNKFYIVWSVGCNYDCNKRGQTSRPVIGTEIQTSCNFKANLRDRYYLMGFVGCLSSCAVLESPNNLSRYHHTSDFMSSNFDFLLHKDFPQSPSTSKSSTKPCSATELNKSTEHNAIQKGRVGTAIWLQLTLVACYLPYFVVLAL